MDIEINSQRRFKGFSKNLSVTGLNKFVALTGSNGAGKTQLLQIIEGKSYIGGIPQQRPATATVNIDGETITEDDIFAIFDWSQAGDPPAAGMGEITQYRQLVQNTIHNILNNNMNFVIDNGVFDKKQKTILYEIAESYRREGVDMRFNPPSAEDVNGRLPDDFNNHGTQIFNDKISRIIWEWHFDAIANNRSVESEENPITIFNLLCRKFDFPYSLPPLTDVKSQYFPVLKNTDAQPISWNDLSSGEKVIVRILCLLFFERMYKSIYPKLILLDEPDAHLTPKMIKRLITNIQEVIVNDLGLAVIMTTHSPNTVALCEEDALYMLSLAANDNRSISKITTNEALQNLSEGLLFVMGDNRLVFLEGTDDIRFYESQYNSSIRKYGHPSVPSVKFIAASVSDPDHGGRTEVVKMIDRFETTNISSMVHGIIDNDNNPLTKDRTHQLKRYSIESYIYDPVLTAVSLIIRNKHKDLLTSVAELDANDWQDLMNDPSLLQDAIDEVLGIYHTANSALILESGFSDSLQPQTVRIKSLDTAISYSLPEWFVRMPKRILNQIVHNKEHSLFLENKPDNQYIGFEAMSLVFSDVADIFSELT